MKKTFIFLLLAAIIMKGLCFTISAVGQDTNKQGSNSDRDEKTKVYLGKDISVEEKDSSINLKIGNRGLNILESLEGSKIKIEKYPRNDNYDQEHNEHNEYYEYNEHHNDRRRNRFRGHWAGIEFGFNNYLTSDNSNVMPADIDYMTLHSGKSSNFNINFTQLNLGLARHVGFVTGLGLTWNNYRFDRNNNIIKGDLGIIEELDPKAPLEKSKLTTLFLDVPFMLEVHIPVNHNTFHIAAGPIGAAKLASHTKMVFEEGAKVKSNGDFSLNMLRCGATARIGYENFQLYGTYYGTPLFRTGKGPAGYDLYPFEIGIAFTIND